MINIFNLDNIRIKDNDIIIVSSEKELYYKLKYVGKNYNITTLKNHVLDLYNGKSRKINDYESYIFMLKAKENVNDKLLKYNNFDSYDFISELLDTYDFFYNFDLKDNDKISDLEVIYEEYERLLTENNYTNERLIIKYVISNKLYEKNYVFLDINKVEDNYLGFFDTILKNSRCDFYIDDKYNNSLVKLLNNYECDIKTLEKEISNVPFVSKNDIEDECDYVISDITKKLVNGSKLSDFIIIAKDVSKYEPYFNLKLKFNYTKESIYGILTTRVINVLKNIFNGDFSCKSFLTLLKLNIFDIDSKKIDDLENYVYSWSLEDSPFYKAFTYNPNGNKSTFNKYDEVDLKTLNDTKDMVINPIMHLLQNVNGVTNKKDILKELYTYLDEERIIDKLYEYDAKGVKKLNSAFDVISNLLDDNTSITKLINILSSFNYKTTEKEITKDQITLSNLSNYNLIDKKYIYLLGCSNEDIPGSIKFSTLIDKEDIKEESLINYINKKEVESLYDFKNIVSNGAIVSFHKLSTELSLNTLSSYLKNIELKKYVYDLYDLNLLKISYAEKLSEDLINKCEIEEFEKINKAKDHDLNYKISDKTASLLYTNELNVSPSSIEVYAKCPFYHFCNYGLRLRVKEKYEFDNREVGTFVHYILENVLKNDFDKINYENIEEHIYKYSKNYLEENGKIDNNKTRFILDKLSKSITLIIRNMLDEKCVTSFRPRYFEFEIGEEKTVKPYTVNLDNGTLKLSGVVDRVDVYETEDSFCYRIVDYKTGGKTFKLQDVLNGLNLQMLLYLLAIKNSKITNKNIIPAGLLYYPALVKDIKISRKHSNEEINSEIKKKLKMNGILNKDEYMIDLMGGEDIGEYIDVTSRGKLNYEKLFGLDDLNNIFNSINKTLKDIGNNILSGNIKVNPIKIGEDSCKYCKFESICKYNKDFDKKRKIEKLKNSEVLSKLGGDNNA